MFFPNGKFTKNLVICCKTHAIFFTIPSFFFFWANANFTNLTNYARIKCNIRVISLISAIRVK